jgi:hypothetical protein
MLKEKVCFYHAFVFDLVFKVAEVCKMLGSVLKADTVIVYGLSNDSRIAAI